ncbi:SPOR domain-containing protein [Arhodomonas sp. AD133]|uniref:SPOR domain-containing protein n=1 Tax=Arhodomonas sp. AD133 TaxID=3415009 RepID=UPI003EB6C1E4
MRIIVALLLGLNVAVLLWGLWHTEGASEITLAKSEPAAPPNTSCRDDSQGQGPTRVLIGPYRTLREARAVLPDIRSVTGRNAVLASGDSPNILVIRTADAETADALIDKLRDAGYDANPPNADGTRDCLNGSR